MKKLFLLVLIILMGKIAFSQSNTIVNTITIKDSLRLKSKWITNISDDETFLNATHSNLPTQKAVKLYVDNKSIPLAKVKNIDSLRLTPGSLNYNSIELLGYYKNGDGGGGAFYWNDTVTAADNGGTIIKVNTITTGRWIKNIINDEISVKCFGAKGDGSDDTEPVRRLFNTFKGGITGGGMKVIFPEGTYKLDSIPIYSGMSVVSYQLARDNYIPYVRTRIIPTSTAKYVFYIQPDAKNIHLSGLFVDGEGLTNPNLKAALFINGSFHLIEKCSFTRCVGTAVKGIVGTGMVRDNLIAGWVGPAPVFTDTADFRGALEIDQLGDSYILNNEISGGIDYFNHSGTEMLRDSVYGRICAMVLRGQAGTSWVSGNFFENGDRAVVINGGVYGQFWQNRYELSGMGALLIRGTGTYYIHFTNERFSGNNLSNKPDIADIKLEPGALGYSKFTNLNFERLYHPLIPQIGNKVRYNFDNRSSYEIGLINPTIDTSYLINPYQSINTVTVDRQPTLQVDEQFAPRDPNYNTVKVGWLGNKAPLSPDTVVRGGINLIYGASKSNGGKPGSISFFDAWDIPILTEAFDNSFNFNWTLFKENARFIFAAGDIVNAKNGSAGLTLQSNDGTGANFISFLSDPSQTKNAQISLNNTTGAFNLTTNGDMSFYSNSFTFVNGNILVARTGSVGISTISADGTGTSTIRMSSDPVATHAFQIGMNNLTGETLFSSSDDIVIGAASNGTLRIKQNGQLFLPFTPLPASSLNNKDLLVRDLTTGEVQIGNKNSYILNQSDSIQAAFFKIKLPSYIDSVDIGVSSVGGIITTMNKNNFTYNGFRNNAYNTTTKVSGSAFGTILRNGRMTDPDTYSFWSIADSTETSPWLLPGLRIYNSGSIYITNPISQTTTSSRIMTLDGNTIKYRTLGELQTDLNITTNTLQTVTTSGNTTNQAVMFTGLNNIPASTGLILGYSAGSIIFSGNAGGGTFNPLTIQASDINISGQGTTISLNNINTCGINATGLVTTVLGGTLKLEADSVVLFRGIGDLAYIRAQGADALGLKDFTTLGQVTNLINTNTVKTDSYTTSGTGVSTTYSIPHSLGMTPSFFIVQAASADAKNISWVEADASNIIVHYDIAPLTGTNNLIFKYTFKQ